MDSRSDHPTTTARWPQAPRVVALPPASRFHYRVRPARGKWEVVIGEAGPRFVYPSCQDALQVAQGAAGLHWRVRHEPSGVSLTEADGHVRTIAIFGP